VKWNSVVALLATLVVSIAQAETLDVDLNQLIDAAAASKNRFAVDIPYPVSGTNAWVYSVRIPGAVSMSFHASDVTLPGNAALTVTAGNITTTYRGHNGALWGPPLLGDTLTFTLSGEGASIHIQSFQAGYRALGGVVPDHPHYTARIKLVAPADCTQNYSCNATDANRGPARSTVAVLVGNQFSCTGTLLNNTSHDATPYVLTARHCETGEMGGGNPDAAQSVTIYWDAVTSCGSPLGSIYEGNAITQFGATTVVEQQDAWLIRLNSAPAAADAYFAGWDATGSIFTGGYSVHHALGNNKQFVGWSGQAVYQPMSRAAVGVNYESTFWALVNGVGNTGAGASGGALFDPANRVVGSATLATLAGGENSAGVCPVNPPPAPTAQYTALAGVWTSTADTTSTTGDRTLQSVLDPTNTGRTVIDGFALMPITFAADTSFLRTDQQLTLSWNVPDALSCTASGGWTGARAASGSVKVSSLTGGHIEYVLSCQTVDRVGQAAVAVDWTYTQPVAWVGADSPTVNVGDAIHLNWYSNIGPCTASGGQTGDGWAGAKDSSGIQTVPTSRAGTAVYTLTCGTWANVASYKVSVTVVGFAGTAASTSTANDGTANSTGSVSAGSGGTAAAASPTTAAETSASSGGGGSLDLYGLSVLGALLLFRARANRWSPASAPRGLPAATRPPSRWQSR
jgi:lysyl endopeptidase